MYNLLSSVYSAIVLYWSPDLRVWLYNLKHLMPENDFYQLEEGAVAFQVSLSLNY